MKKKKDGWKTMRKQWRPERRYGFHWCASPSRLSKRTLLHCSVQGCEPKIEEFRPFHQDQCQEDAHHLVQEEGLASAHRPSHREDACRQFCHSGAAKDIPGGKITQHKYMNYKYFFTHPSFLTTTTTPFHHPTSCDALNIHSLYVCKTYLKEVRSSSKAALSSVSFPNTWTKSERGSQQF